MKSKVYWGVLCFLAVGVSVAFAMGLLNLPAAPVAVNHGPWNAGANSTIDITLIDVPQGFDVMSGTYAGWCLEDNHQDDVPDGTMVTLLDSTDSEPLSCPPGGYGSIPWDKINYLLNNKQGTIQDIQAAMWIIADTDDPVNPTFPTTAAVQAMVDDANANGSGFVPGSNDVIAVILCGDGLGTSGYQDTIIEVPFTPSPYCGDGIVNGNEECEPGVSECGENQICNAKCMCEPVPYCGDGIVNGDEECEPGVSECGENQICNAECMCEPVYEGCSRTPGYWKTHPLAWPVGEIMIGGDIYTKADAIAMMWMPVRKCKERTMFNALVAAKLNVLSGASDGCIAAAIADADAWMEEYADSCVKASSDAWKYGETLYIMLDDYNNGLLCIPHCE